MTDRMAKSLTFNRKKLSELLCCALCIFLIILVSACGDAHYSSSETSSISFSVEWRGAPTIQNSNASIRAAALDCEAAGVATVRFDVCDVNDSYLAGDSWPCSYHQGTVHGVPVGSDRKLIVTGEDSSGNVLYRAEKSGIIVTAGQTTDVGTIVAEPFNLALLIPSDGTTVTNGAFAFQWSDVIGTSEYQIQVSEDTSLASTVIDETVTTTHYVPTTTLSADTHYWRVRAEDSYGNQSAWSAVWSFIVSAEPGVAPSTPTNVVLIAGNEELTISWDTVSGATSYNIYWSTSQGVTKDTGTKISDFSSPYTHTGLTNGTTYYYVVTAENSYGESGESSEVSATPSATGTAPSIPTNLSATAGDQQITISWVSVTGATSYNIYWSTSQGVSKDTGTKISTFSSPYTHTGLTNGTTYYYVVTAENSYGESDESREASATPSAYTITQLTDNSYGDAYPQINNNGYVVWEGGPSPWDSEIYLYDGTSITQITDHSYDVAYPEINNNGYVVWEGSDGSDWEIFLYDGTSITQITDNSYDEGTPQINDNGYVVWHGNVGGDFEIFLYDGTSITQITDNSHDDGYPQINDNGYVVWQGHDGGDSEIFLYDGTSITQITDNSHDDGYPQINNNGYVAWLGSVGPNNYREIYLYDGTSITELTRSYEHEDQGHQINDNGYVVWYGYDGSDWEIFLYDGTSITQITDNSYDEGAPQINDNGYVVWYGYDGSDAEIFLAR